MVKKQSNEKEPGLACTRDKIKSNVIRKTWSCGRARVRFDEVCRFPEFEWREFLFFSGTKNEWKTYYEPLKLLRSRTDKVACK